MSERIDTLGMWDAMLALPEQVEQSMAAIGTIGGLPNISQLEHVIILGMGDSGFGGDVAAASARPFSSLPIVVYGGYLPPSWVGSTTLVIAISASGTTEETLESLEAAVESGASLVAVTSGGELESLARRASAPVLPVVGSAPMPRAALGAMAVPAMLTLEQLGLFPGARTWLTDAVQQLKKRRDELSGDASPAREVARRIGRTMPIIYGGGVIGTTAAKRWKIAVNHNAKAPAFWAQMPELCHNELVGWGQHGDVTRQVFTEIQLRHEYEHPQTSRRFQYVEEKTLEVMNDIVSVEAAGEGPVAQLLDLVMVGDMVSLELAAVEGLDPGPLPIVDDLKAWLDMAAS
ncbi:MAG: SIS domain-containing protein [Acidimicrobiales bacterium]|nr:SIS domain-containing protein [Acidimicrobiales bacterium]